MLENHADASRNCGLTVGNGDLFSLDENFAPIGLVEAVQDRHQGGFASAVFPDDPVNGARHHPDRDILVGLYRSKGLGNPL